MYKYKNMYVCVWGEVAQIMYALEENVKMIKKKYVICMTKTKHCERNQRFSYLERYVVFRN
jgi:hypothetical protein